MFFLYKKKIKKLENELKELKLENEKLKENINDWQIDVNEGLKENIEYILEKIYRIENSIKIQIELEIKSQIAECMYKESRELDKVKSELRRIGFII